MPSSSPAQYDPAVQVPLPRELDDTYSRICREFEGRRRVAAALSRTQITADIVLDFLCLLEDLAHPN